MTTITCVTRTPLIARVTFRVPDASTLQLMADLDAQRARPVRTARRTRLPDRHRKTRQ